MTRIAKVANVDDPDEDTDDGNDLGEQVSKVVDLLLEGRLLRNLSGDGKVDISDGGSGSSGSDDGLSLTVDDGRSLLDRSKAEVSFGEGKGKARRPPRRAC